MADTTDPMEMGLREILAEECDKRLLHAMARQIRERTNFSDHLPDAALSAMRRAVLEERAAIIAMLPGGTHCDPQRIADAIRSRSNGDRDA